MNFGHLFAQLAGGRFERTYRCRSIMRLQGKAREEADRGGKSTQHPRVCESIEERPPPLQGRLRLNRRPRAWRRAVFLPPDALEELAQRNVQYPMMFSLTSKGPAGRKTHAGVLEFIAEPGHVYIPGWVGRSLEEPAAEAEALASPPPHLAHPGPAAGCR